MPIRVFRNNKDFQSDNIMSGRDLSVNQSLLSVPVSYLKPKKVVEGHSLKRIFTAGPKGRRLDTAT